MSFVYPIFNMNTAISPTVLAPVAAFGTYVLIALYWKGGTLLTAQAFTSVALVTLLTTPFITLIQVLPQILQCVGCFDRLQEYFCYSVKGGANVNPQSPTASDTKAPGDTNDSGLNVPHEQSFSWANGQEQFLHCSNLRILPSAINVVVGSVGSGKSALLQCLLGEMIADSSKPYTKLSDGMGYCSQQPWLENTTVKKCITGPLSYNSEWYDQVKRACALDVDIRGMPDQDGSKIGSDGLNLSGGQKQRLVSQDTFFGSSKSF